MDFGLASVIVGFLTSVIPVIVGYYDRRSRQAYEIELAKIRLDILNRGMDPRQLAADIKALVEEGKDLRSHDSLLTSNEYINILRASVRPVLTYFFFFLFVGIKVAAASLMFQKGYDGFTVLQMVWDKYTVGIFGAIMGFWFGTRSMVYVTESLDKDASLRPSYGNTDKKEGEKT